MVYDAELIKEHAVNQKSSRRRFLSALGTGR